MLLICCRSWKKPLLLCRNDLVVAALVANPDLEFKVMCETCNTNLADLAVFMTEVELSVDPPVFFCAGCHNEHFKSTARVATRRGVRQEVGQMRARIRKLQTEKERRQLAKRKAAKQQKLLEGGNLTLEELEAAQARDEEWKREQTKEQGLLAERQAQAKEAKKKMLRVLAVQSAVGDKPATDEETKSDEPGEALVERNAVRAGAIQRFHLHICADCDYQVATRHCTDCNEHYCDVCFRDVHSAGFSASHAYTWIVEACEACETYAARYVCLIVAPLMASCNMW